MNLERLSQLSPRELLQLHAGILDCLRGRGIIRSFNNPVGDLAEHLFCQAFNWQQAAKSAPCADAQCSAGRLYQIKGRRLTKHNASRQLGAIRDLPSGGFHFLAAVLFDESYGVHRAAIIPHELVARSATYVTHTNSWKFMLPETVWGWSGVQDVTAEIRAIWH